MEENDSMKKEFIKTVLIAVIGIAFALSSIALIGEKAVGATWWGFVATKIVALAVFGGCVCGYLWLEENGYLPTWVQKMLDEEGGDE